MTVASPIPQKDRTVVVDVIRGFALVGVLLANFTSYVDQQTPEPILNSMSSPLDLRLMTINSIFFEWKFMTLFSILFGYGFGLILQSLLQKNINPNFFFAKRMFWLFIFGCIHSLFWWADVLHLYAMSGILLLIFRNKSNSTILICAILFAFIVPQIVSYAFRNQPETFTGADIQSIYDHYKTGSIVDVINFNIDFYYRMFIVSGSDLTDITETLGRFLFGYFLLRINLFHDIQIKKHLFKRIALFSAPLMIAYFIVRWLLLNNTIHVNQYLFTPFIKLGILSTTTFYVSVLVLAYASFGMTKLFLAFQALGRMTLTNYLLVSAFLVILLYGFGFNRLGIMRMHMIWICAFGWLLVEIFFSIYWLRYFRYGPAEWIWRQLSYGQRLELRREIKG